MVPMSASWSTTEEAALARRLVRTLDSGVLSTQSLELPGYPFGSVTPYAMTHEGRIALYVSGIAQHTANMEADPRVSLTVAAERGEQNQQAVGRVTVIGDASLATGEEAAGALDRYLAFFPEAAAYGGAHAFSIYWIEPRRVRFIGGFGQIFWVEEPDWSVPTPEWQAGEAGIVQHMNEDHVPALKAILFEHGVTASNPQLIAVDPEGFHARTEAGIHYVPFPVPCMTSDEVRQAMIQLARA